MKLQQLAKDDEVSAYCLFSFLSLLEVPLKLFFKSPFKFSQVSLKTSDLRRRNLQFGSKCENVMSHNSITSSSRKVATHSVLSRNPWKTALSFWRFPWICQIRDKHLWRQNLEYFLKYKSVLTPTWRKTSLVVIGNSLNTVQPCRSWTFSKCQQHAWRVVQSRVAAKRIAV